MSIVLLFEFIMFFVILVDDKWFVIGWSCIINDFLNVISSIKLVFLEV